MHRSGTSVIAQWLYRSGLHLGKKLLEADIGNKDGHFEDTDFVFLHEYILRQHRLSGSGLTDQLMSELTTAEIKALEKLVAEKKELKNEWGWKDPRTCLFLSAYRQLIPEAVYLVVIRDFRSVVSSLIDRDYKHTIRKIRSGNIFRKLFPPDKNGQLKKDYYEKYSEYYLKVWISYNKYLLAHIALLPESSFILVSTEFVLKHDQQVIAQLKRKWGFTLEYISFSEVFKKDLVNQHVMIDSFIKDSSLINEANQINHRLKDLLLFPAVIS